MNTEFSDRDLLAAIDSNKSQAEDLLKDPDKMEKFLQKLEKKLSKVPLVGDLLSDVPILVSFVRAYIKKEYSEIPLGTIISVVAALLYFFSPIDIIPDIVPAFGYLDDAALISLTVKLVRGDLEDYRKWRDNNVKNFEV